MIKSVSYTHLDVYKRQYQFKKYVLTYSDDSVIELKKNLSSNEAESLLDLLVNDKVFEKYKKN